MEGEPEVGPVPVHLLPAGETFLPSQVKRHTHPY